MLPEHYHDQDDVTLMAATADGDMVAFGHLVRRHQAKVTNFFIRMGVTQFDAEDLLQETFLKIHRMCQRYRPDARFTTFLYTVARNTLIDRQRRNRRRMDLLASYADEIAIRATPSSGPLPGIGMDIAVLLARLSPKLREVVVLVTIQGLQYDEAAAVLAIPVGTIKSRLNQAMLELRKMKNEP